MDVNNTPYFLLRSEAEFEQGSSRLSWHAQQQALTLAQNQQLRLPASDPTAALKAWQTSRPLALDRFNQVARLSLDRTRVEFNSGRGFLPLQDGELKPVAAPTREISALNPVATPTINDLQLGGDDLLALAYSNQSDRHGLILFHLSQRWQIACDLPAEAHRAWPDADNRVWCITPESLMLCQGGPLPLPYNSLDSRFEPMTLNPRELALSWQQPLPSGLQALAITGDKHNLYILCHDGADKQTILSRSLSNRANVPFRLFPLAKEVPFSIDLGLASAGRLAALAPRQAGDTDFVQRDCPVLTLRSDAEAENGSAELVRERYPMLSLSMPRFVSSADGQLRYQAEVDPDFPEIDPRPRELHALRRPRYHLAGSALLRQVLDSGQPNTIWHRLYLDACIPPGCSLRLSARVYDAANLRGTAELIDQPEPIWNPLPSELAFAPSLAGQETGTSGLFEILLQRYSQDEDDPGPGPVRRLTGRYLQLQVHFQGNGRHTPALFALRVYHPRFSYQEAYLPELLRQELSYDPAHNTGPANGADTRERFLAALEGMLTPIEGRVAATDQLLHPDATPAQNLPWLAELLGTQLARHWPLARQRRLLKNTTLIQQYRGTLEGVRLALDIATDGGVQRGEVVLLENFRLRRSMASLLGVNMDDQEHPLTLGTGMSGNSIIGDSLILSEIDAKEFLALFAPQLANEEERQAVQAFFEQYAHRISVLLHGNGITQRSSVEETLQQQMPAHLEWQIIETERPFVLGIAPLLAVDTFLETAPAPKPVELNDTWIGQEGLLKNPAAFSPRDINAVS